MGVCASAEDAYKLSNITPNKEIGALLKKVPVLAKFTQRDCAKLGGVAVNKKYKDGATIIRQGDRGHGFFVLVEGEAVVYRTDERSSKSNKTVIGHLHSGDYFGEASLINDSRTGASVVAQGPVKCYYWSRDAFNALFGADRFNVQFARRPEVSSEPAQNASTDQRVARMIAKLKDEEKKKDNVTRQLLRHCIKDNLLFSGLTQEQKDNVIDEMWSVTIKAGTMVIKQGEIGDFFYCVESGTLDIHVKRKKRMSDITVAAPPTTRYRGMTIDDILGNESFEHKAHSQPDQPPKAKRTLSDVDKLPPEQTETAKVATRERGSSFGELAMLYGSNRAASVVAVTDCKLWVVDRWTFRRVVSEVSQHQLAEYVELLKKVELLQPLSTRERAKLAEALELVKFDQNATICNQGDDGHSMYIVKKGRVACIIDKEEVRTYTPGQYFGEKALLENEKRAATMKCLSDVEALRIDRGAFTLLLGPLQDIMKKRIVSYRKSSESKLDLTLQNMQHAQLKADVNISDLEVLGTLGCGSFSHVRLVRDRNTGATYALKAVYKAKVVEYGQQSHLMSEKMVLSLLEHPFLIKLHGTFKDRNHLYFLLEPCLGGELFRVMRQQPVFDENTARFVAGCIVLALEFMHSKKVMYRDIKPENILLDEQGYIKLADFGFAKRLLGGSRAYTLCGTPDYLAPEIVAGKGHGFAADWWTLGILIYEMLAGYPPFFDEDEVKTYNNIMEGRIRLPSHFSPDVRDLIAQLLRFSQHKRLGVTAKGVDGVKEHAWFRGLDWKGLASKTVKAPSILVPTVRGANDLSNFDDNITPPPVDTYVDDGSNWDADF